MRRSQRPDPRDVEQDSHRIWRRVRSTVRGLLERGASVDGVVRVVSEALASLADVGAPSVDQADAFWARVDKAGDCWLWQGRTRTVALGPGRWPMTPRRYAWLAYRLPLPAGRVLVSTCGTSGCVRPDHARLGMPGEGSRKPRPAGSMPTNHRLTPAQVREIRAALDEGAKHRDLADKYRVARETIVSISTRASWANLPDEPETTT